MSAERILVTGGAGFIGSHLVDKLLSRHYQVRVLDNLSSGKRSNLPLDNPALQLQVGDVADAEVVNQALQGCSAVVHLAAVASVQASVDDPAGTHRSNFIGTLNVCQGMAAAGIKRVVFASSAAVYGSNGEGTAIDEDTPKAPLTPYAADKLASEFYLDFYRRQHGLEPVVLRFFNIFGPRQDPSSPYSGVISIFAEKGRTRQPVTVFGDGEQTRDFVYVADLVEILLQALEGDDPASGAVNVGLGRTTSLNQLIKAIDAATDTPLTVTYQDARPGDIRHSRADNRRLQQRFELNQPTTVADGLRFLLQSL
ncbi:NAD-dependent epimerase/dehydratase family protein [Pseudomonas sp. GD03860]|uniref:NAD-dependent epimerase/dehydratase family protein n=1 Tax=Pseudomonas TaxID=286 RepID=UPI002364672D|nr:MULTISPECIES: NAD-dependent epimerase/dehydratase family protein [Pseudomonas]MDD2058135.1 NAD-dependent epimerase/dehydratase family protein [Pseudomonas putida]MDH0636068.1 NAD-dependent epimerase/dehydratase family protein [Pseudomonas sp. GD03860]